MARSVIGVDSSTQSCKAVLVDADSGALLRQSSRPHPAGTEVDPRAWLDAMIGAVEDIDGFGSGVIGLGIGAQQHGMVALDERGDVIRPALLWNDTRSAAAADDLVTELGAATWAEAVGSVPVASFTVTKLRWMAEHEPQRAGRTAGVCLPHDWLTAQLLGVTSLDRLVTDRGDASGTGYWSPSTGAYRTDLIERALGHVPTLPRVLGPWAVAGVVRPGLVVSAGTGDNMGAALGLGSTTGDLVVSIGTSGVVSAVSATPSQDPSGIVAGFADATGRYLPLACTLNGAPVLAQVAALLDCDLERLAELALAAPPGAEGLVLVPYFDGERTPNLPNARGHLVGMTLANTTPANLARAAIEGILCGLADGADALEVQGVEARRIFLVGGGAQSRAVQQVAATVFDVEIVVPAAGEHVALGAAHQAVRAANGGEPLTWPDRPATSIPAVPVAAVRERYREAADAVAVIERP